MRRRPSITETPTEPDLLPPVAPELDEADPAELADPTDYLYQPVDPGQPTRRGTAPRRRVTTPDAGMNTAEYAVGTLAAVAFAGILLKVLTSESVQAALAGVVQRALG